MKRVALVVPWAGNLPWYWTAWKNSAAGRCFDVIVIRKTVEEFSRLVGERLLNTPVRPELSPFRMAAGYKLCDLRPMFGVLFAEELRGYDYWAYGDCDLLYGRLFDAWIEKAVSGNYDVATVQEHFTAGPFTIVRNCEKCNRLFEKAPDWREILSQPKTMAFDELGANWFRKFLFGRYSYEQLRKEQSCFAAICWREWNAGRLRLLAEQVICEDSLEGGERVVRREDGALLLGDREIPLYHFICAKGRFGFTGDDHSVWVSRGWPFVRDVLRFGMNWLRGNPSARRRVAEWVERRRGNPDWWRGPAWNNMG